MFFFSPRNVNLWDKQIIDMWNYCHISLTNFLVPVICWTVKCNIGITNYILFLVFTQWLKSRKKENKYTMNIAEAICFYYPCFILLWFTWQIVCDVTWKNLLCNFSRLLQYLHTMYVCANKACYHCCCILFIPLQHLTCHWQPLVIWGKDFVLLRIKNDIFISRARRENQL